MALIPVSAAYLNLFDATTTGGAVDWILVTMLAIAAFTAVAPRQAGYLAAVAAAGLGLYLLSVCAAFPPGVYEGLNSLDHLRTSISLARTRAA